MVPFFHLVRWELRIRIRLLEDANDFFGKYLPVENVEKVHGKAMD